MPSTHSIINSLQHDYPSITFTEDKEYFWSPEISTVHYKENPDIALLLHEVAHAVLGHENYTQDIELLKMEREAWDLARSTLAKRYKVTIHDDLVESMLDSYRDWLHDRSLCPSCRATGIQVNYRQYTCLACTDSWRVNEARSCALRRYTAPPASRT